VCLPILDKTLSSLEAQVDLSPRSAFSQAKQLLGDGSNDDTPLRKASLLAILSSASVELSRPDEVRRAISEARETLRAFSPSASHDAEIKRILSRLLLDEAVLAVTPEQHRAAIPGLDQLIESTPMISEERACAMITRSQKHSDLHEQELAASDALTAYRIAVEGNFEDARIGAAIVLAIAYWRSGLYDAGERMIREPIELAEQGHRPSDLAVALYTYSQILVGMRRYPEASAVALRAREAYRQFSDPFGDALTGQALCHIEIEEGHYDEAARYCREHDATFAAAHRADLISMELAYQSRLSLMHGDIAGADRLIEKAFGLPSGFRSRAEDIELLESRARVRQAQGHDKAAAEDLLRVIAITRENSAAERARAITLLSASAEADRLLTANKLLVAQAERQQVEIQNHQLERRLRVTVGGIGAALASLFCYVYWSRARYERAHAAEARVADVMRTSGILRRANERLANETDLSAFMAHVLSELCSMAEADAAAVYESRSDSPHPVLIASHPDTRDRSLLEAADFTEHVLSAEDRQSWHALLAAKDVITLEGVDQTPLPSQWTAWLKALEYQRALAIPLLAGDMADGFIVLAFRDSIRVDPVRMEFAKFLAQQAMIAIRLTRLSEMMSRTAMLEERTRLARDLHDTMAQSFTGIYMQLQAASRYAESNQSLARACIERAQTLARDGLREARQSVLALTSRGKTMDVTAAVSGIAQVTSAGTACPCTVTTLGESRPIDSLIGGNVVAICREAISNAQRYAQATEIAITVTFTPGELGLRIQDNGEGFAVPEASQSGFGLTGMQARGERIGGIVSIASTPGAGTTVEVRVPLSQVAGKPNQ
jgi:signal transduction histidine kinase